MLEHFYVMPIPVPPSCILSDSNSRIATVVIEKTVFLI